MRVSERFDAEPLDRRRSIEVAELRQREDASLQEGFALSRRDPSDQ
jgi:hypothetical protein